MRRDPSREGALLAAAAVALYLPLQPVLAQVAGLTGVEGANGLDGLARWTSTAVVLLLGAGLATVLAADWRRRRGAGTMQRWATGATAGLAVLIFLSSLLTLTQALLTWAASHALALALVVDAAVLAAIGSVALVAVTPHGEPWPSST
jgi:hypothetical protein